jgi:hypothetical protein
MKKPASKTELLTRIQIQRRQLDRYPFYFERDRTGTFVPGPNLKFSRVEMAQPGAVGEWSVKDVLAHLFDWEQRFVGWYEAGRRGEVPPTPAPRMMWKELGRLNQQVFEKHRQRKLDDVLAEFDASYRRTLATVQAMPEDEMFQVGRYA